MNKALLSVVLMVLVGSAVFYRSQHTANLAFENWKAQFGANWSQDEEQYRKIIFQRNYDAMIKHNADQTQTYKMGINQFSVLTDQEFIQNYLTPMYGHLTDTAQQDEAVQPNSDIDWSTKGIVSPIKNQGTCGSCYAFSATGVLESMARQKGQIVSLSEQQIVDCSGSYGNLGCYGGLPKTALRYVKDRGIASESQYPYTAVSGSCKKQGGNFKISEIHTLPSCSGLTSGIQVRPLSVTVDAASWKHYSSGVITECGTKINHAVLLVGIVGGNWKIKNSWGSAWGESGYIRLGPGNTCAICQKGAVYAL